MNTPMDRIDELLEAANPVRPSNTPRLDASAELRAALENAPALHATGQDFVDRGKPLGRWSSLRRPWTVAAAVAALSVLVIAVVVLARVVAPLQPVPPAVSPSPSVSTTSAGTDGWRVLRLSTTQTGGSTGPQIQIDVAPGFTTSSDVPNESYDSLSIKIIKDSPTQDVLAQIYYGKVLPQRDPVACVATPEEYVELESVPSEVPVSASTPNGARFVYRVLNGAGLKSSFGITSLPPGSAVDSCTEYHHVESLPDGTMLAVSDHFQFSGQAPGWLSTSATSLTPTFTSLAEARAFMGTDEYQTYKRMLSSVRIIQPE
ncbi:hypothetical protein ACFRJ9_18710 [Paenarthrobacter sp. NPDC056912]|uniref:hypothetical protein n=1 Tax=Paenarthrobacter sp. NPDC056912 TaxID=3345965 RepID=UPI00366F5AE0